MTPNTLAQRLCGLLLLTGCLLFTGCNLLMNAGITKLAFGCLPEGTRIDTPEGPVPVERLRTGDLVIGYHGEPVVVRKVEQYDEDPDTTSHLTVLFSNGSEVSLSPRHRIGGIPAGQLRPGDRVGSFVVSGIRPRSQVARSFDLLTEDPGYRIESVPVNSMIEEMAAHARMVR